MLRSPAPEQIEAAEAGGAATKHQQYQILWLRVTPARPPVLSHFEEGQFSP
jgi:hypothetical protein